MLAKRLFQKAIGHHHHHNSQHNAVSSLTSEDLDFQIVLHYGIPSTSSILAFDPIQRLLAIGTLDGRIKVIGGDNIEALFISSDKIPYKYLEFLQNQGFLISIRNDNIIQVWNLGSRNIAYSLQWESNVTALSVICGSNFMYVGDEYGVISVIKYSESGELLCMPYKITPKALSEEAGFSCTIIDQPVVGVLPQPCSVGNRVLVAYEGGLIILWDIVKAKILVVRGDNPLQLTSVLGSASDADSEIEALSSQHPLDGKEISSLCWVSRDGSILAVGYVDGDILFWKTSTVPPIKGQHHAPSNNVVKLQLSSVEKRIPVIVLHWLSNNKSHKEGSGHLLIYGGDEIGSDEVLTILALEWSAGMETLKCLGRKDLNLSGSFADIVLASGMLGSDNDAALFLLTNPGQLQMLCCSSLSSSILKEKGVSITAVDYPAVIPTVNPLITLSELFHLPTNVDLSKAMFEITNIMKSSVPVTLPGHGRWPLTGGVHSYLSSESKNKIGKVFVAGYQDGSVRIWDATYPVLSFLCALESQIRCGNVTISVASVSKLAFCFQTLRLAVGDECGLVCLYEINSSDDISFYFITETKREVHQFPRVQGPKCRAAISLLNSRIEALEFTNSGAKLAVGYECCRIAVLDMNSLSALFLTDIISSPSSSLTSMICKVLIDGQVEHLKHSEIRDTDGQVKDLIFMLTNDGAVHAIDAGSGNRINLHPMRLKKDSTTVSLYVIESGTKAAKVLFESQKQQVNDKVLGAHPNQDKDTSGYDCETGPSESHPSHETLDELLVLVCCRNVLRLYAAKSVVQGNDRPICKIKLTKPCCWTTTFLKDDKICGLLLLYQTGEAEIRSLPDLKFVKKTALMPLLRWNFKGNMEKTMSSTNDGHISLVNGSELAFMSILVNSNDFRIPESLPSLHDEVLAAAAGAALSLSSARDKKQGNSPQILSGIIRGFKREKANSNLNPASASESWPCHLEDIFTRDPFPKPSTATDSHLDAAELHIDDIVIDEPMTFQSTSNNGLRDEKKKNKADREKLLGANIDAKPRLRTREEIMATYRKTEGASSAAGEARNKLLERQEKLERISKRTEELQSGAEDFASLANELVKVMESRKWWHI